MRKSRVSGRVLAAGICVAAGGLLTGSTALAQTTFEHVHWTPWAEEGTSIEQTPDGGYIEVATRTEANQRKIVLHKLDQYGFQQWTRVYQTQTGNNTAQSVRPTRDGGYIIAGETNAALQPCGTSAGILLIKVDALGNVQWANGYYGSAFTNFGGSVVRELQGNQGGFVVIGRRNGPQQIMGGVLVTTDANGVQTCGVEFQHAQYGPQTFMSFNDVRQNTDGTFTVVGWVRRGDTNPYELLCMRTRPICGTISWAFSYGNPQENFIGEAMEIRPNSYAFCGNWRGAAGAGSFCVVTDPLGMTPQIRVYRNLYDIQSVRAVAPTGELIMTGQSNPAPGPTSQSVLMRTSNVGAPIWAKTYGAAAGTEYLHEAIPTLDGGFAATGLSNSYTGTGNDSHIIKTLGSGDDGCNQALQVDVVQQQIQRDLPLTAFDIPPQCRVPIFAQSQLIEDTVVCPVRKGCVVPPRNLVLWLPLDETAGVVGFNAAGGNNGTHINGAAVVNAGAVSNSKPYSPAVGQYTNVNTYGAINPGSGPVTVDAWINWRGGAANSFQMIVDKRNVVFGTPITSNGYSMFLRVDPSGTTAKLWGQVGVGATYNNYNSGLTINQNQWTFCSIVVNRNDPSGIRFYSAPASAAGLSPSAAFTSVPYGFAAIANNRPLRVGSESFSATNLFNGSIDEVEVFRAALTQAELEQVFDAKASGKCKVYVTVPPVLNFCLPTQTTVSGTAKLYNFAGAAFSPAGYWFFGLPTGMYGSNITGPTPAQFTPNNSTIPVPYPGVASLPYTVGRPVAMTAAWNTGSYQFSGQFPTPAGVVRSAAGVVRDLRFLCFIDTHVGTGTYIAKAGVPTPIGPFRATNTSGGPMSFRLRARVSDDQRGDTGTPPAIGLNGLPPGVPWEGNISLPDNSSTQIPLSVLFADEDPISFYSIILEADLDGDGEYEPLGSALLKNDIDPTCAGDYNQDGVVDFFDYLDFVAAFDAEDAAADFNNDGVVDFFDYLDFVAALEEGCP
jgi:hypothetical protein